jgi:hypothetical protein
MNVNDLQKGQNDAAGDEILGFYARKPPQYAVYQTALRAAIQYADETAKADEQRKSLTQFAPLRGEINGLLQSWREAPDTQKILRIIPVRNGRKLRAQAERYDRRVADALIVGLEGDYTGAGEVLKDVKDDIVGERVGWARLEYLLSALTMVAIFVIVTAVTAMFALQKTCVNSPFCFENSIDLWRGAMSGSIGAFFSIALGIRGRTMLTDLHRVSNLTDAALRVAIGIIAGMVLVALVLDRILVIQVGASTSGVTNELYYAIAGFLAGFSERMVPDLLAKAEVKNDESPVVRTAARDTQAAGTSLAGETAATPGAPVGAAGAASSAVSGVAPSAADAADIAAGVDPVPAQAQEDGCVADEPLADDEVTPDEALPAASGGVAVEAAPVEGVPERQP